MNTFAAARRVFFFLLLVAAMPSQAQFLKSGDIRVYANAMVSSQLNAEMARKYGISRSQGTVLLHVVVRQGKPGKDRSLPATLSAVGIRQSGERSNITMQRVQDDKEFYYLGELNISGNEAVNFEIITRIENHEPMRMTFFQEFFSP